MRRLYYPLMKMAFRFATATAGRREYLKDEIQRFQCHDAVVAPGSLKKMLDEQIAKRKSILSKYIDLRNKRGLEIGPLHAPTVSKSESDISYMDYKTRAEQIQRFSEKEVYHPYIPETDILCPDGDFTKVLTKKYDYVIANHVIEHIPDMIGWLKDWEEFIEPGGIFYLAIPDKRFTFDKDRPETTAFHLLADYHLRAKNVNFEEYLQTKYYSGKSQDVFLNYQRIADEFESVEYIDTHYHVFNHENFQKEILEPVLRTGILRYSIMECTFRKGSNEFILILRKQGDAAQ